MMSKSSSYPTTRRAAHLPQAPLPDQEALRRLVPLLPVELDFTEYSRSHERGERSEKLPYGLDELPQGWSLHIPRTRYERGPTRLARLLIQRLAGADIVGAFQRLPDLLTADVIYAHTELEYLGAAFWLKLRRRTRPLLVGQTIWLLDSRETWGRARRQWLRWALSRVDLFVYNALPNYNAGRTLLPDAKHSYIPFGAAPVFGTFARHESTDTGALPLILAVGNDRSRDWETFRQAVTSLPEPVQVRVATRAAGAIWPDWIDVSPTTSLAELAELYQRAACVVIPVAANLHASGITVALEAASVGAPIVASKTGGLDSYFAESEAYFVPVGEPEALKETILRILRDPDAAAAVTRRARERVEADELVTSGYWRRVLAEVDRVSPPRRKGSR